MPVNWQIGKYLYNTITLFSNIKEPPMHTITWINLRNIILSERKQTQKNYILSDSIYMKCLERGKS